MSASWFRRAALGLALAGTVGLAACGGGSGGSSDQATTVPSGPVKGQMTFWIQSADPFVKAARTVISGFERENPGAKVKLVSFPFADFQTRLTATLPVGRGPDALEGYTPWMTGYMRQGQLDAVPSAIGSSNDITNRYYQSSLGQLSYKGRFYGLPANVAAGSTRVLLSNDNVVKKAGVTLPSDGATFEDWQQAWSKLTKREGGRIRVEGLGQSCGQPADQFISYLMEYGGSLLSGDGRTAAFDSPAGLRSLQLLGTLAGTQGVDSPQITDANCLPQGVAATGYRGTWVIPGYTQDFPDFKWSYHQMPLPPGATKDVWQGGSGWGTFVPAASKNKELAWAFLKYLDEHRAEWISQTGEIPANRALAEQVGKQNPKLYGAYLPILDQSRNAYTAGDYFVIYQALSDMATSVTLGKATPQAALDTARSAIDDHLKQWWSQYPGS